MSSKHPAPAKLRVASTCRQVQPVGKKPDVDKGQGLWRGAPGSRKTGPKLFSSSETRPPCTGTWSSGIAPRPAPRSPKSSSCFMDSGDGLYREKCSTSRGTTARLSEPAPRTTKRTAFISVPTGLGWLEGEGCEERSRDLGAQVSGRAGAPVRAEDRGVRRRGVSRRSTGLRLWSSSCQPAASRAVLFVSRDAPPAPPKGEESPGVGEASRTWDRANPLRKRTLGPHSSPSPHPLPCGVPAEGLAQVPGAVRAGGRLRGHLEVSRLQISHLGQGPGSRGLEASPDASLFTSARLSQCHAFLARNDFQESGLWELIGSCSERAFTVASELRSKLWAPLPLDSESYKAPKEFFQQENSTPLELEVLLVEAWEAAKIHELPCGNKGPLICFSPLGWTLLIKNNIKNNQFVSAWLPPPTLFFSHQEFAGSVPLYEMSLIQIFAQNVVF